MPGFLKPEVKEAWVTALRSGEYRQGQGRLRGGLIHDCYCCLGVLVDLMVRKEVDGQVEVAWSHPARDATYRLSSPATVSVIGTIPTRIAEGLISDDVARLIWEGEPRHHATWTDYQSRLTDMNDMQKKNFSEIADWIEATL